jgi:hypothetical protein
MNDTFDDERLETYFFDSSSSMDLSKQYFTVLQLLRDARRRIEDNHADWKRLCGIIDFSDTESTRDLLEDIFDNNEDTLSNWKSQLDTMSIFFDEQTKLLQERIDRKTEEVKSLRDGVCPDQLPTIQFNASPLCIK